MKIGDRVRFLSEKGGGIVAGFQSKNIVLVEDEDGFQIPTPVNDVVVVGDEDYSTANMVKQKSKPKKRSVTIPDDDDDDDPADRPVTFVAPAEERKGGDLLSAYLAFVPIDVKELTNTRFETYIINDCNYEMQYTYLSAEGNSWKVRSTGRIEPNTKLFVEEFGRDILSEIERVAIQITAYKKERNFLLKPTVDVQLRIDPVKFYKLHTFRENDFFEQAALIYDIVKDDQPARQLVIDAKKLKEQLYNKVSADVKTQPSKTAPKRNDDDIVVVDLHADEILETTAGMSNSDILNYQLDVVRKTIKNYENKKGQKIVFIHGKGEGVLRRALINEIQYRYKRYQYQDASFQEYGYGATQITIK